MDKNERQSNHSSIVNEINFWIETQIYEQYLQKQKALVEYTRTETKSRQNVNRKVNKVNAMT